MRSVVHKFLFFFVHTFGKCEIVFYICTNKNAATFTLFERVVFVILLLTAQGLATEGREFYRIF